jgi:putative (di)nucleoside polyphosphate hydrolase
MLMNDRKEIFVGRRIDTKIDAWQMPQGGIDDNETPSQAVMREMLEEVGTNNAEIVAESSKWFQYNLPDYLIPKLWGGQYRGQKQKWFILRFLGQDSDFNLNTAHPEFAQWRWASEDELTNIIVPFKRRLYEAVIAEFKEMLRKQ